MHKLTTNKKARHDYHIINEYEAGIVLTGSEVKSCRNNDINLSNSYCFIDNTLQIKLINAYIAPFKNGGYCNHEPERERILLMHKREILRLKRDIAEKGMTIIPLEAYFNNHGLIKIKIGVCKGKNAIDKRETIKKRDCEKELKRKIGKIY
jgi:SsrA-binding protein